MLSAYNLAESNALKDAAAHDAGWSRFDSGAGINSPEQYGYPRQ